MLKLLKLLPSSWTRKLGEKLFVDFMDGLYAGDFGEGPRKIAWALRGKKTLISVLLGVMTVYAHAAGLGTAIVAGLGTAAAVFALVGLADKSLNAQTAVAEQPWFRFLYGTAHNFGWVIVAYLGWVYGVQCHDLTLFGHLLTCGTMQAGTSGLVAALLYLGVIDASLLAEAPIPPADRAFAEKIKRGSYPGGPAYAVVALLVAALFATGCASGQFRVGSEPKPPGVDLDTVVDKLCYGATSPADKVKAAEVYIEQRGGKSADQAEYIARARKKPCPCPAEGACLTAPTMPIPSPSASPSN